MNRKTVLSLLVLLASMLACAVPLGMTPTPVYVTQVIAVPQNPIQPTSPPPLPVMPTSTLAPTNTPVSTATATPTATLSGPVVTFIMNANCREGPGTKYNAVTSFYKGDTVKIVGRNPDFNNTWWYVEIPTGGKCWVSLTTGQASGDFDAIPTVKP